MTPAQKETADSILHASIDEAKRFYIPGADIRTLRYCVYMENRLIQPRRSLIAACEARIRKLEQKINSQAKGLSKALRNGCDVGDLTEAMAVRWLEFQHPELVDVVGPMGQYKVTERLPKLGAILKPEGRRNFDAVEKCLHEFLKNPNYERGSWKKQEG